MEPQIGQFVHYRLTRSDASTANWQRVRAHEHLDDHRKSGVQWHKGNQHYRGDVVPLLIVRVWPYEFDPDSDVCRDYMPDQEFEWSRPLSHYGVNGQAFLDGNDTIWVTSVPQGTFNGAWNWIPSTPVASPIAVNRWEDDGGFVDGDTIQSDEGVVFVKTYDIGELERVGL